MTTGADGVLLFPLEGLLWPATVLDQYRDRFGVLRVVAQVTTGPGASYILVAPAEDCQAVDDPPEGWTAPLPRPVLGTFVLG